MRIWWRIWTFVFCAVAAGAAAQTNVVFNASFESSAPNSDAPDGWSSAGNPAVKQQLVFDTGRDGQRCAKLECTDFSGDDPDYHAMICQSGTKERARFGWTTWNSWSRGWASSGFRKSRPTA